jgi:hypothetical protein
MCLILLSFVLAAPLLPLDAAELPKATIDGTAPGFEAPGEDDFINVNCAPDTWSWKDGVIHCTGQPIGVLRLKTPVTNFELVVE